MKLKYIILSSVFLFTTAVVQAEVVVVVGAKAPIGLLGADQVSQIFLGQTSTFPGGGQAEPIDQKEDSATYDEFYSKVTGMTPAKIKSFRMKVVFTGKGLIPKKISGDAEVKKMVAENPNLIGYINKSAMDSSVKVVLTP